MFTTGRNKTYQHMVGIRADKHEHGTRLNLNGNLLRLWQLFVLGDIKPAEGKTSVQGQHFLLIKTNLLEETLP